jgi:hypothetical protein
MAMLYVKENPFGSSKKKSCKRNIMHKKFNIPHKCWLWENAMKT